MYGLKNHHVRVLHQQYTNVVLLMNLYLGGSSAGDTPVPIPNTEVKTCCADGTVWVTAWESRALPRFFLTLRILRRVLKKILQI